MEIIRWAKIKDKLHLLPLDMIYDEEDEMEPGVEEVQGRGDIRKWSPALDSVETFPWEIPKIGGRLMRYSAEDGSDDCFEDDEESMQTESNEDEKLQDLD